MALIPWRSRLEWRLEPGPGYELRQYQGGKPTGRVAVLAWDHGPADRPPSASGPDVWLIRDLTVITVAEHGQAGRDAVRLRVPLKSCVDSQLADEPGLPGAALVQFTLTVRIGRLATFTVPLWFSADCRPFLDDLSREIQRNRPAPPRRVDRQQPGPPLPLLAVGRAPDDDDWVVFRPSPGDGVLAPDPTATARSAGERP